MEADSATSRLRRPLTTRQKQDLINQYERSWLQRLHKLKVDAGHHPFLAAADSEVIEARFHEKLRQGVPFDRTIRLEEFPVLCASLQEVAGVMAERAVITFSRNEKMLGAFVASCEEVTSRLDTVAEFCDYELGLMTVDAGSGLSLERTSFTDAGECVPGGLVVVRAWGGFVLPGGVL